MKDFRVHQKEAVDACLKEEKGIVILPTGTGKSLVQFGIIDEKIKEKVAKNEYGGVYVIVSPRIILSFQHLANAAKELIGRGYDFSLMNVNSGFFGGVDLEKLFAKHGLQLGEVLSTTNFVDVKKRYDWCKENKKVLIVSSTYDSVCQIQKSGIPVSIYLFDEAHNMVDSSGQFNEAALYFSENKYFFTATPKNTESDQGKGMNNEDLFGKILYRKTPKEMINAGEMVRPAIHFVSCPEVSYAKVGEELTYDYKSVFNAIVSAFEMHKEAVQKHSANASKIGAKMVVTLEGQRELLGIWNTPEMREYLASSPSVKIFALSSDFGVFVNGKHYKTNNASKEMLLNTAQNLSESEEAIIFHIHMLTEGIDVPGITGQMIWRNVGIISFLQNVGRAARLHAFDRERLYDLSLVAKNNKDFVKPFAWIILPILKSNSLDSTEKYKNIIRALRSDYGFDSSEMAVMANRNAMTTLEEFDEVNGHEREIRSMIHITREFVHQLEEEELLDEIFDTFFNTNIFTAEQKAEVFAAWLNDRNFLDEGEECKIEGIETV